MSGPHAITFVKDLLTLNAGFDVPHGGRAGKLDLGLWGERPGMLGGREAREDVTGVVRVRGPRRRVSEGAGKWRCSEGEGVCMFTPAQCKKKKPSYRRTHEREAMWKK